MYDLQGLVHAEDLHTSTNKRRKFTHVGSANDLPGDESQSESESTGGLSRRTSNLSCVEIYPPSFPPSECEGWHSPYPTISEKELLAAATALAKDTDEVHGDDDVTNEVYIQLNDFCIYTSAKTDGRHNKEFACLSKLSQDLFGELRFDGAVTIKHENRGSETFYVVGVPFESLMIGYDQDELIEESLWISSKQARLALAPRQLYYQLGYPSDHYLRFYKPFLWLALFTRYFVDFLTIYKGVVLRHFRRTFLQWVGAHYQNSATDKWLAHTRLRDFRTTVVAHSGFLWKECCGLDNGKCTGTRDHPLWSEIDPKWLTAIPRQPEREAYTIVTPFTFDCFSQMYFSSRLKAQDMHPSIRAMVNDRKAAFGLTPLPLPTPQQYGLATPESMQDRSETPICQGDVVCLPPDRTIWKRSTARAWYAYVQSIRTDGDEKVMDLIWLYEPSDTTIGQAQYPFAHELFMSDNCECGQSAWPVKSAIGKLAVSWNSTDPYLETTHFVRRKFRTVKEHDSYDFVKLQSEDFKCACQKKLSVWQDCTSRYESGDCVLVLQKAQLWPALLVAFDNERQRVILQELRHNAGAAPNELVASPDTYHVGASKIIRKFHLRVLGGQIPAPYDRGGAGDLYFMREEQRSQLRVSPRLGWDPSSVSMQTRLSGLGLFCGGGNFDRGIEEGGAVDFRFALDLDGPALHSYRANARLGVNYFLGSANDALARALDGDMDPAIAKVGEVEFIAAGSPCQGFSNVNPDRLSPSALQHASMVASVIAYMDLYNPQYCILENVLSMTDNLGPNKDQNVFSQMIASLIAMGYQVQQWLGDAWSVGSPQNRSRLFIIASAPGLPLLELPAQTHAHPPGAGSRRYKNLGMLSNNLTFATRQDNYTPFAHTTPEEATKDLPVLGGVPPTCIHFPDHRTSIRATALIHRRIAAVPTVPQGMSLAMAGRLGRLSGEPLEYLEKRQGEGEWKINSFSRIRRDGLFPTIITRVALACRHTGRWLHWQEPRVITVMEARRAQGFLDHEVIVGSTATQMKIVGNSVDRKIALVLGLRLRESWEMAVQSVLEN